MNKFILIAVSFVAPLSAEEFDSEKNYTADDMSKIMIELKQTKSDYAEAKKSPKLSEEKQRAQNERARIFLDQIKRMRNKIKNGEAN